MDQNENKNLESVAEKATEVKDEVVEAAKETAEEVKEVASKVFTEENKAKINEATEKAVDKVESYNKNNLFEKIFFGVSIALAIFTLLVLLNGLSFAFGSNGGMNITSLQAAYRDLSNKFILWFIILLCISRCRIYWIFLIPSS